MPEHISILGVSIDPVTRAEALARCREAVEQKRFLHVVTANPEIVLRASRDPAYKDILDRAGLVIPDGAGLLWAARQQRSAQQCGLARQQRRVFPERVTGVELLLDCCRAGFSVMCVGGKNGVAEQAAEQLRRKFPSTRVTAFSEEHQAENPPGTLWSLIVRERPQVLALGYGAPLQEEWIVRHRSRLVEAGVCVAMGVGGTFDIVSGRLPRAPQWMQQVGLEWLWRLLLEPWRLPRILRATMIFPLAVVLNKKNPRA